jgi:aminoglycoside phosphotransferase (APT) family kinase protein
MTEPATATLAAHQLAAVAAALELAGVPVKSGLAASQIAGGRSNLTFLITDTVSRWVLRMPPVAGRTPSAHDVAREWRITAALESTDVPVARAVALGDDPALGGAFAVWEFVPGHTLQTHADLDPLPDPVIEQISRQLMAVLARLHAVDPIPVGLERLGRPDGYAERQLRRWSAQWEHHAADDTAFDRPTRIAARELLERLRLRLPAQQRSSLVHGDFRIDNTLLDLDGQGGPQVAAVVDWELSTLGDPVADLAMTVAYGHPAFDLIQGRPAAATSSRVPAAAAMATMYEDAGGVALVDWESHLALAHYKIAMIAAGIDHRYRSGGAVGDGFDTAGAAVLPFIEQGLEHLGRR